MKALRGAEVSSALVLPSPVILLPSMIYVIENKARSIRMQGQPREIWAKSVKRGTVQEGGGGSNAKIADTSRHFPPLQTGRAILEPNCWPSRLPFSNSPILLRNASRFDVTHDQ